MFGVVGRAATATASVKIKPSSSRMLIEVGTRSPEECRINCSAGTEVPNHA